MERKFKLKEYGLSMTIKELSNGLTCYIIPKKDYIEKMAVYCVKYGSCDTSYILNGKINHTKQGIAHFLEHKLFESEQGDVFSKFAANGADVNAFTDVFNTAYYFSCVKNFKKNLEILLDLVSNLHLTDENVEKEKGIIAQEIAMYDDNAFWQLRLNMLSAMYKNCPVKNNIAGDVEDVKSITKEMLLNVYEDFYFPENCALICVGDIDPYEVYEASISEVKFRKESKIKRVYDEEPSYIVKEEVYKDMNLSRPMFSLGFKETDFSMPLEKRIVTGKLLMDIIAGESSEFFNDLYENSEIDSTFSLEYNAESIFGMAIFSGTCENPKIIKEKILKMILKTQKTGIDKQRFEQIRKKHLGLTMKSFNKIENLALSQTALFQKETTIFDFIEELETVTIDDLEKFFNSTFKEDRCVLSVINPIG